MIQMYIRVYSAENRNLKRFLSNLKVDFKENHELNIKYKKNILLIYINKVIKLLKFRSAVNICTVSNGRRNRERATRMRFCNNRMRSLDFASH